MILKEYHLSSVPVFSGELQVLGKKSSVTSVILENIHLYRLTPVGAFFQKKKHKTQFKC